MMGSLQAEPAARASGPLEVWIPSPTKPACDSQQETCSSKVLRMQLPLEDCHGCA